MALAPLILLVSMLVIFLVSAGVYMFTGRDGRRVVITGLFIIGALVGGFAVWQMVPSDWTLPFWTTLRATVDAETYGERVEHYAEGVVLMMELAAVVGGAVLAVAAAVGTRLLPKLAKG